ERYGSALARLFASMEAGRLLHLLSSLPTKQLRPKGIEVFAEGFECGAGSALNQLNMQARPNSRCLNLGRPMARREALAHAFNGFVKIALTLPDCAEAQ